MLFSIKKFDYGLATFGEQLDYTYGKLVGLYLAEGSSDEHTIQFALHRKEDELAQLIKSFFTDQFGFKTRDYTYGNSRHVNIYSASAVSLISRFVQGHSARSKHLTREALNAGIEFLRGLVDGWLAGDAHYDIQNNRFRLGIARNYKLVSQLRGICRSLGYSFKSSEGEAKYQNGIRPIHRIEIRKEPLKIRNSNPFFSSSSNQTTNDEQELITLQIKSIEPVRGLTFYDIGVDGDHVFATADMILTHNSKRNSLPSSVKDRFSNKWEYIFFFVKSRKYYFDLDAVRNPLKESSIKRISQNVQLQYNNGKVHDFPDDNMNMKNILIHMKRKYEVENVSKYLNERTPNGSLGGRVIRNIANGKYYTFVREAITNVNEYLKEKLEKSNYSIEDISKLTGEPVTAVAHYFRTDSSGSALPSKTFWNKAKTVLDLDDYDKFIREERKSIIPTYEKGANPGDVLEITTRPHHFAHFAVFPTTLVSPLMKAGCPPQGVVLDPFAGSGTTGVVAEILGRNSILIEISQEYVKIIEERLQPENLKKESEVLKRYEAKIRGVRNANAP